MLALHTKDIQIKLCTDKEVSNLKSTLPARQIPPRLVIRYHSEQHKAQLTEDMKCESLQCLCYTMRNHPRL